jgi:hypothetical protein
VVQFATIRIEWFSQCFGEVHLLQARQEGRRREITRTDEKKRFHEAIPTLEQAAFTRNDILGKPYIEAEFEHFSPFETSVAIGFVNSIKIAREPLYGIFEEMFPKRLGD